MSKSIWTLLMMLTALFPTTSCSQNKTSNAQDMKNRKTLVVFFSRTGENYAVGNIKKGNTHIIAEMITEETNGTLFLIEPVTAYPEDFNKCTEIEKQEAESKARPAHLKKSFLTNSSNVTI